MLQSRLNLAESGISFSWAAQGLLEDVALGSEDGQWADEGKDNLLPWESYWRDRYLHILCMRFPNFGDAIRNGGVYSSLFISFTTDSSTHSLWKTFVVHAAPPPPHLFLPLCLCLSLSVSRSLSLCLSVCLSLSLSLSLSQALVLGLISFSVFVLRWPCAVAGTLNSPNQLTFFMSRL